MIEIAFFDTKQYDQEAFDAVNDKEFQINYIEHRLNKRTAVLAQGCEVACAFVSDRIDAAAIDALAAQGVKLLAMRCAGYNNVDVKYAAGRLKIVRVPDYSPYAVAEHAMALLMSINRKIHKAYSRTRDFNFSLNGLTGTDVHGKTIGVVGTGKIGRVFINICRGYGLRVMAYDPFPAPESGIEYTDLDTLFQSSDFISLHCPLTDDTYHLVDKHRLSLMKKNAILVNTSRGALVDSEALLNALRNKQIHGVALDVYEEEENIFFEDHSNQIIDDSVLQLLVSMPNVLITSHQAFLTREALNNIAATTLDNIRAYAAGKTLANEVFV